MTWYKFWKKSGPMQGLDEAYRWLTRTQEGVKYCCENWANKVGGGFSTLYTYGFEEISHPPLEVLEKMIENEKSSIKHHRKSLTFLEKTLKEL